MKRSTKKLKYKLQWLQLELEEVLEINAEANAQFLVDFAYCLDEQQSKTVEHQDTESFENTEEVSKKLFKEIAVKTHPDKLKEDSNEVFVKANKANKSKNFSELLSIAEDLNIDTTKYLEDESLLQSHCADITHKIREIKERIAWIWYHTPREELVLMKNKIEQLLKSTQ